MIFLAVIIVFALQRYFALGYDFSRLPWVKAYARQCQKFTFQASTTFKVAGIIVPASLIIWLIQIAFGHGFWGIIKFALDIIVLWFCWDVYSYKQQLRDYFSAATNNNSDVARQQAMAWATSEPLYAQASPSQVARVVSDEIFMRSAQQIFAVLFWFIILGAFGAVAYFLILNLQKMADESDSPWAELLPTVNQWLAIADWLPVRLLALSYALVGHFTTAFSYLRKNFSNGFQRSMHFAIDVGFAALNLEHPDVIHADKEENEAALLLVDRALLLWIVILAIFTLGGWLR